MNEFFPLTERGIHRNRRIYAVRVVITIGLFGLLVLAYVTNPINDIAVLIGPGVAALAIVCYFVWRASRLRTHGIQLTDAWIAEGNGRSISGRTVVLSAVARIESTEAGALLVSDAGGSRPLHVDQETENIETLRTYLAERWPIVPRPTLPLPQRRPLAFLLVWLIVSLFCLALPVPVLALSLELLLCFLLGWWMFASRNLFGVEIGRGYRIAGLWLLVFFGVVVLFGFMRR